MMIYLALVCFRAEDRRLHLLFPFDVFLERYPFFFSELGGEGDGGSVEEVWRIYD